MQQTCLSGIEWGIPKSEVSALNTHYQWWSKAGGGPGYSHELEKDIYIQDFNWLSNWIDKYFFNKKEKWIGVNLIGTKIYGSSLKEIRHIIDYPGLHKK